MQTRYISIFFLTAVCLASAANPLKGRALRSDNRKGIADATLTVEYVDDIETFSTDRKGKFKFCPKSYPVTITFRASDMSDATIGLISNPEKPLTVTLSPTGTTHSTRRPDWSTAMKPRLASTYTVVNKQTGK